MFSEKAMNNNDCSDDGYSHYGASCCMLKTKKPTENGRALGVLHQLFNQVVVETKVNVFQLFA